MERGREESRMGKKESEDTCSSYYPHAIENIHAGTPLPSISLYLYIERYPHVTHPFPRPPLPPSLSVRLQS